MTIIHMIPFLWSGAGGVVTRLARSQARLGNRVVVITSGSSQGFEDWPAYRKQLSAEGIPHVEIELFHRSEETFRNSVAQFIDSLEKIRPDIVHSHSGVPAAVAAAARDRSIDFRLVGQLHSWGRDRPAWMDRFDLEAFDRCDVVIANSRDYARILADAGIPAERIVEVPWGIPLDELELVNPRSSTLSSPDSGYKIGFTGRIERRKQQRGLVECLAAVRGMGLDATLELIGPVAEQDYARSVFARSEELGVRNHVRLLGVVDDVFPVVAGWDVFVSMSTDEGQGMAVLEAMALGVPVVSTSVAGVRDFLRAWENAMVVRFPSATAMAAAVKWLLEDPALAQRLARNAREMVAREYRWEQTVSRMEDLYHRLGCTA